MNEIEVRPKTKGSQQSKLPRPAISSRVIVFLLIASAFLICARMPNIVLQSRFWGEEGLFFYQNAWFLPWYQALFTPIGGYLCFVANVGGVLARYLMPIEYAPYVTITIGLFFQLCPILLLATSGESWVRSQTILFLAAILIITVPTSGELWLQTLHSQFHLALCGALILSFSPSNSPKVEAFRLFLLISAGLTGLVTATLLPLFLARALIDRSGARFLEAAALGSGLAIQLIAFYTPVPGRLYGMDPTILISTIFVRHIALPIFGTLETRDIAKGIQSVVISGGLPILPIALTIFAAAALIIALVRRGHADLVWLSVAGFTIMIFCYNAAFIHKLPPTHFISPDFGPRYTYVPLAVFALVILGLGATGRDYLSWVCLAVSVWFAVIGLNEYFWSTNYWFAHGPAWRPEVAAWRMNPTRPLKQWPQGWTLVLPPGATTKPEAQAPDPRLCAVDVKKFCNDVQPGEGRVITCLINHKDQLGDACIQFLYPKQPRGSESCTHDVKKFCNKLQPGAGRVITCLIDNEAKLSDACRQFLYPTKLKPHVPG